MYCKHCGKQIADDSKFCPGCGGVQEGIQTKVLSESSSTSNNISTKATEIYLRDLLSLESARMHLREKEANLHSNIQKTRYWGDGNDIRAPKEPQKPTTPFYPVKSSVSISDAIDMELDDGARYGFYAMCGIVAISVFIFNAVTCSSTCVGVDEGCNNFFKAIFQPILFTIIAAIIFIFVRWIILNVKNNNEYSDELKCYLEETIPEHKKEEEEYKKAYEYFRKKRIDYIGQLEDRKKESERRISAYQIQVSKVNNDIKKLEKLLASAYSANIIPSKYRSLYPVYFIHDYIASSGQSLENALLHCQLDKLETQLGAIIKTNYMIILQNAVQIAQNNQMLANQDEMIRNQEISLENDRRAEAQRERIIDQNKAILDAELENARNTAEAAKYSRIAAINSDTTAFFSTYDHLK